MADQDFKVNIVTTADTRGARQVGEDLDKIARRQTEAEAKWLRSPLNPKNQTGGGIAALGGPTPPVGGGDKAGSIASAAGVGTIISLLTGAITKWKEFIDEENKIIERMEVAREKTHALGLEVADVLDAMKSAERIETEPLEVSFERLTQKVRVLKTEMKIAFETGDFPGTQRLIAQLSVVESQLNRVTAARKKANDEAEKSRQKNESEAESFAKNAVTSASPQVQAALANEMAARRTGDEGFRKTSEAYQRGMTPEQQQEFQQLSSNKDVIQAINDLRRDLIGIWR